MDSEKAVEQQLNVFFSGLESGIKCLREFRSVYDEQVAFDFNPIQLFGPNENTVTNILAYLLNPEAKHGQKDRLLKVFLKMLLGEEKTQHLLAPENIVKVSTQFFTENGRPVDAVITFGSNVFMIGIENKVFDAEDQEAQVRDYVKDLRKRSGNNFLMLYLSPSGGDPSAGSIESTELEALKKSGQFKAIPFSGGVCDCSVLSILKAMATEAKADSVRAFVRLMITYFESYFGGGTTMDEHKFVLDYVRRHPGIMEHQYALNTACDALKNEFIEALLEDLKGELCVDCKRVDKGALYYLPATPRWKGNTVPIVVQVDFAAGDGLFRIGIWSNDKSMNALAEAYRNRPVNRSQYTPVPGCWEGGCFVAQEHFMAASDLTRYFQHKKLPDFKEALDKLRAYCERITEICQPQCALTSDAQTGLC